MKYSIARQRLLGIVAHVDAGKMPNLKKLIEGGVCGNLATLLLSKRADAKEFGGDVVVDRAGQIRSFRPLGTSDGSMRRRVFCGAHVFAPELLEGIDKQPADFIADLYERQLEQGQKLGGLETSRPRVNGTMQYVQAWSQPRITVT